MARSKLKINGDAVTLTGNGFSVKYNINGLSDDFNSFLTNPDINYEDLDGEDEEKNFLFDIGYDVGKSDKGCNRLKK